MRDDDDDHAELLLTHVPLTSLASMVFFGSTIFAYAAQRTFPTKQSPRSSSTGIGSCKNLLESLSLLGLIMFYVYLCEHHPPFAHGDKAYDRDGVFFLMSLVLALAFWTGRPNSCNTNLYQQQQDSQQHQQENAFLNRQQTEEWKGW